MPPPKGPAKRKTRTWDPSPAISIDNLPAEKQEIANQNRPKRVKTYKDDSRKFVLDYNRTREIQDKYKGEGKPFTDAAEIERRQPRSKWRPPPLSLVPAERQTSTIPKKTSFRKPPGPPGPLPGPPPGGPGGLGSAGRKTTAVPVAPVTSAAVSTVTTSGVTTTGPSGTSTSGPRPPIPTTDWREELAKGNFGWGVALGIMKLNDLDIEAEEASEIIELITTKEFKEGFRGYMADRRYDGQRLGSTGHVSWWLRNFAQRKENLPQEPFEPLSVGMLNRVRAYMNSRAGREDFINRTREYAESKNYIIPGTIKDGPAAERFKAAPTTSKALLNYLPASARPPTKTLYTGRGPAASGSGHKLPGPQPGTGPGPKSAAQPGLDKGQTKAKSKSTAADTRPELTMAKKVAEMVEKYRYLTSDITLNTDPANYFTQEGLEKYIRETLEKGQSIKLKASVDFKGSLGQKPQDPPPYQISDDALKALVNIYKHYTENSSGFSSTDLTQYIRMIYERGEKMMLRTRKGSEGMPQEGLSETDLEALLNQYSHLIDRNNMALSDKKDLENVIQIAYSLDRLLDPVKLPRRPAGIPAAEPLAPKKTKPGPAASSLTAEAINQLVDKHMEKYGQLCTGPKPLWDEKSLRAYIRGAVEKGQPITLPPTVPTKPPKKTSFGTGLTEPKKAAASVLSPKTSSIQPPKSAEPKTAQPKTKTAALPAKITKPTSKSTGTSVPGIKSLLGDQWKPHTLSGGTQTLIDALKTLNPASTISSTTSVPAETIPSPSQIKQVGDYPDSTVKVLSSRPSTGAGGQTQTTKPINPFSAAAKPSTTGKSKESSTGSKGTKIVGKQSPKTKTTPKKSTTNIETKQAGGIKNVIGPMIKGSIVQPPGTGSQTKVTWPPPLTFQPNIAFNYVSDLHLEQTSYDNFDFNPTADYLILAGDIGYAWNQKEHANRYREFLARMCAKPRLKRVFLVAGNRDYWPTKSNTVPGALAILRGFAEHPSMNGKLIFMEDDRFEIKEKGGKIVVLGATLWTENPNPGGREPLDQNNAQRTARHKASCDFIRRETAKIRNDPKEAETRILIITHMPPSKSGTSDPAHTAKRLRDFKSGMNHGSDVIDGVKGDGYDHSSIKTTMPLLDHRDVWIYGHTHYNEQTAGRTRHGGMRFECNQRGNARGQPKRYNPHPPGTFQPEKIILV